MSREFMVESTEETIGDTPLVYLRSIGKEYSHCRIAVKIEYLNPTLSIKDRIAKAMVDDAEKRGIIQRGKSVLVEGTSGNFGIALAHIGKIRGYKVILVMSAAMSTERRAMLRSYGAEIVLTDSVKGHPEIVRVVNLLVRSIDNAVCLDQFSNIANPKAHFETTGPEIWRQTEGAVDAFVAGVGSGGTFSGVSKFLHEENNNIKMFAVEPVESSVINGFPRGVHGIHGIGAGIIPNNFDPRYMTQCIPVATETALQMAKLMAEKEGIVCGISSGANISAALTVAEKYKDVKLIVTIVSSYGERYFSTQLYQSSMNFARKWNHMSDGEAVARARNHIGSQWARGAYPPV